MAVYAAKTARSEKMWIQPTAGSSAHAAPHSQRGGNPDVSNSRQKNSSMAISAISAAGRGGPDDRDRRLAIDTRQRRWAAYRLTARRRESAAARHAVAQDDLARAQKFYPAALPPASWRFLSITRPRTRRSDPRMALA